MKRPQDFIPVWAWHRWFVILDWLHEQHPRVFAKVPARWM